MMKIENYKAQMLARKAAASGCTVAELLARGERDAGVTRRANEIRRARRTAWPTLAAHAARNARTFATVRS